MCGRKSCRLSPDDIVRHTKAKQFEQREQYKPRWNIAPTSINPVVVVEGKERVVKLMRWGLIPSFTDAAVDDPTANFNARDDTLTSSPMWKRILHRRCVVICDGFFEWKSTGGPRTPYFVHAPEEKPLLLAGLWDANTDKDGKQVLSYTVVTTDAGKLLGWLHDRMPVVLCDDAAVEAWLDCSGDGNASGKEVAKPGGVFDTRLRPLLRSLREGEVEWHEVSDAVNSAKKDIPDVVRPIAEIRARGLDRFFAPVSTKRPNPDEAIAEDVDSKQKKQEEEEEEEPEHKKHC